MSAHIHGAQLGIGLPFNVSAQAVHDLLHRLAAMSFASFKGVGSSGCGETMPFSHIYGCFNKQISDLQYSGTVVTL